MRQQRVPAHVHAPARRVLQLFEPDIGGVPGYVAALASGMVERGWDVIVAGPESSGLRPAIEATGGRFVPLRMGHGPSPRDPDAIFQLRRLCRRLEIGLVHAHSTKASLIAGVALAGTGTSSVYTPHSWAFDRPIPQWSRHAYASLERALARWCHSAIISLTPSEERAAVRHRVAPPGGIHVVPTGLRPQERPDRAAARIACEIDDTAFVASWIGRNAPQKRPEDLPLLAAALRSRGVVLAALGQGLAGSPEGDALVRAGGRLLPSSTAVPDLLGASDVLVQTSQWEALPLVILEAMSAGLPAVAYDVGGVAALIEDGVTGYLVGCGDVEANAMKVADLAIDGELRARMGVAAHRRGQTRFGYESMIDGVESVYRSLLRL